MRRQLKLSGTSRGDLGAVEDRYRYRSTPIGGAMSIMTRMNNEMDTLQQSVTPKGIICDSCKYRDSNKTWTDIFCLLYNTEAHRIRESLVRCIAYKQAQDDEMMSHGTYNTKTGKSVVKHDGPKTLRTHIARDRRKLFIKNCLYIVHAFIDSFRVNDFYPLKAALRGEKYELKKEITENSGRNRTSSTAEEDR